MSSEEKNDKQEVRQEEPVRQAQTRQGFERLPDEDMKQVNGGGQYFTIPIVGIDATVEVHRSNLSLIEIVKK